MMTLIRLAIKTVSTVDNSRKELKGRITFLMFKNTYSSQQNNFPF